MKRTKIYAIVAVIIGAVLFVCANQIAVQVEAGREEATSAQKSLNRANGLFSLTPATKQFGNVVTGSAQDQINAGWLKINQYDKVAETLQISGIILVIVGVGMLIFYRRKV